MIEGGSDECAADKCAALDDRSDRDHVDRRTSPGSDLRSKLPDLPANLWQGRQLHRMQIYIDGSVQTDRIGPRGPMHHQSIFRDRESLPTTTQDVLERFRAKWVPVRVKKTRQNKKLEPPIRFNRNGKRL